MNTVWSPVLPTIKVPFGKFIAPLIFCEPVKLFEPVVANILYATICAEDETVPAGIAPPPLKEDVATNEVLLLLLPTNTYPCCRDEVKLPLISKLPLATIFSSPLITTSFWFALVFTNT